MEILAGIYLVGMIIGWLAMPFAFGVERREMYTPLYWLIYTIMKAPLAWLLWQVISM